MLLSLVFTSHFLFSFNFFLIFILFIYFWLHWAFVAARGLSLVAVSGGYSLLRCTCFSLRWLLLLRSTGSSRVGFSSVAHRLSSCGSQALECRISSCGARDYLLCGMWDLHRQGIEPVSPALAGRFLSTVPPGKPIPSHFLLNSIKSGLSPLLQVKVTKDPKLHTQ